MISSTQMAQLKQVVPPAGGTPGSSPSGGWYSQVTGQQPTSPALPTTPTTDSTPVVSNPLDDINKAGSDVSDAVDGTGNYEGKTPLMRGIGAASSAAMAIPNVVADVIPGGKSALNAVGTGFKDATDFAGNIGNTLADISQKVGLMSPEQRAAYDKANSDFANSDAGKQTTDLATTLQNLGNIANTILGAKGTADTAAKIPAALDQVKTAVTPTPPPPGAAATATAAKLKGVADDWAKPTTVAKASYNNARAVLAKDPSTPQFLAEQKLNPGEHIDSNGNYDTADSAQALRDTAGKMSSDTLRPSLQMADYSTPKAPISDIIDQAIKNANADKSLTPGERTSVIRNITKEGAALSSENPDGISLTDSHDSKITYAGKAGYSPIKSAADNAIATANRHIASALQKDVETRAPAGVPVKAFNGYLQRYYRAADYLDSISNKKVPTTLLQNIAHRAAQVTGAVVGNHVGGGVLGGVGGYMIGGALEHAIENLTNPMRATFLKNLEVTNPEAFTKVESYLKAQGTGANGMLSLPDGKAIQLPAPSEAAQMESRANSILGPK